MIPPPEHSQSRSHFHFSNPFAPPAGAGVVMQTVYQIDDQGLLLHEREAPTKGHLQVMVAPPEVPAGHVARWVTALHPVVDTKTYGDQGTGSWEVIEDHRKDELWIDHGKPYTLGEDADGQSYDGLGPLPAWLHTEEPPEPEPTLGGAQAAAVVLR